MNRKFYLNLYKLPWRLNISQRNESIINPAIEKLINEDIQFVILGTGDYYYEQKLKALEDKYPEKVRVLIEFNQEMARKIYASSDFFLMPSLFEPCGLAQLYCMRYGTVPIVRKTGGLVDTVEAFNVKNGTGTGLIFDTYNADDFTSSIKDGINLYKDNETWKKIVKNGIFNLSYPLA